MIHLLVADLGNSAWTSVLDPTGDTAEQIANLAMFSNVQSYAYWSGLEYAPDTGFAWGFGTSNGYQGNGDKNLAMYAVAVHPGDVAATVPEPQTLALMPLGLGAAVVASKRRPV